MWRNVDFMMRKFYKWLSKIFLKWSQYFKKKSRLSEESVGSFGWKSFSHVVVVSSEFPLLQDDNE